MAVKITYFVHSTTPDNENGIASGWSDVGLSPLGIRQAEELGSQIVDKRFAVVFTSDLKRAVDSAALTWGAKYEIIEDRRLRECNYGDYNGMPSPVVEALQEKSINDPMPNGESYAMVEARMKRFLDDLIEHFDGTHVAVVAHRAPQLALDVLLKGMTWKEAFASDWRKNSGWQPGWEYTLNK